MSGTYNRTESYLDQDLDLDLDQDIVGREEHTKFIRNRRRLVLMSVVLIFLLTTVVMVTSVVYVEMNKDVVGYLVSKTETASTVSPLTSLCRSARRMTAFALITPALLAGASTWRIIATRCQVISSLSH